MARPVEHETAVGERFTISIPTSVREEAGIEAGDSLRWSVDENGQLNVEVFKQRRGAFSSLDPIELDDETDAVLDLDDILDEY